MLKTKIENKMYKARVENKSSVPLDGLPPGESKEIEVDNEGTPKEIFWRRRLKDSVIDGCIEIKLIKTKKKKGDK